MRTTKSAREMAVAAQSSDATRKRFATDSELDDSAEDSDLSDFCLQVPKSTRKRSGPNKKPRTSSNINDSTPSLTGVKLPREMTCPDGVTPFSKAHWSVILKTDEFWVYFNRVAGSALKKRLAATINTNLNSEAQTKKDATKARTRPIASLKNDPLYLEFDHQEETSIEPKQTGDADVNENVSGVLTPEKFKQRMAEQNTIMAEIEAKKVEAGKETNGDVGNTEHIDKHDEDGNARSVGTATMIKEGGVNGEGQAAMPNSGHPDTAAASTEVEKSAETTTTAEVADAEKGLWEPKGW